ncbi:MAG: phenylacetate--CoA ligase family protein [Acidobacteria bacterium]|nr:phenylacetate--CoA ligase family protein [Acidobacteriota bacterium]
MFLEEWLAAVIRSEPGYDAGRRARIPAGAGRPLGRTEVRRYQGALLARVVRYAAAQSSFYGELFRRSGTRPEGIGGCDDIGRLPLTRQEDVAREPYRFLCLSRARVERVHTFVTSGTTGPRKKIFWTRGDLGRIVRFMAAGIGTVAGRGDVVHICLPDGPPYSQADLLARGVAAIGARAVVAGTGRSAREHLELIRRHGSTVLFGYAGPLYRLTRELEALCDPGRCGVRVLFLAAEYVPEARRRELERIWNCRVRTHYGLTEMGLGVAVECEAGHGYHFNEADLLLEILDPVTLEPAAAGEEGELVFTTLNREAMPLLRYRTGDLSRWIPGPCPCGARSLLRFDAVRKRRESIVTIGAGEEIYPTLFDDILYALPGVLDYQVEVTRERGRPRLDFRVDLLPGPEDAAHTIAARLHGHPLIERNLRRGEMAPPHVDILPPGALKTAERAKKLVVDRRPLRRVTARA